MPGMQETYVNWLHTGIWIASYIFISIRFRGRSFFKSILKQWTFRFLPFVPKSKVQTEIVFELLMVQPMMGCTYQPFPQHMFMKPRRIYFYIKMIDDTAKGHNGQL
jgi:hypothetical protein